MDGLRRWGRTFRTEQERQRLRRQTRPDDAAGPRDDRIARVEMRERGRRPGRVGGERRYHGGGGHADGDRDDARRRVPGRDGLVSFEVMG
jgi:hypothetical protein